MAVSAVVEVSATSNESFKDAIERGIRALGDETAKRAQSAWVKEQRVDVDEGEIIRYQVNMLVTVVGEEGKPLFMGP